MNSSILMIGAAAVIALTIACGDGADRAATPAGTTGPSSTATPSPRPTVAQTLPTPKPAAETDVALAASSRGASYQPTVAEFRALPVTEIQTPSGKRSGVLLSRLLESLTTAATDSVTFEGRPEDQRQGGFVRGSLKDMAATTVLFVDGKGHVGLASSALPVEQWLTYVSTISVAK